MTAALPFTEMAVRRAVRAVQRSGLAVTAVQLQPDGTILIHSEARTEITGFARPLALDTPNEEDKAVGWGKAQA